MMDYLDRQQIRSLLENAVDPALSIYLPTHRGSDTESRQDRIRLKNAIVEARQRLIDSGRPSRAFESVLEPCRALYDDSTFWMNVADGLVIFADARGIHYYRLPIHFDDFVAVADQFHIRPLLPFLNRSGDFYLLALSERRVRLFRGSPYGIKELDLNGVPRNMRDAFQYDVPQVQHQWHTRTAQVGAYSSGERAAMFHGQSSAADVAKQDRDRFIRIVDRTLNRMLKDKSIPLLLACVDYTAAMYRALHTYPRLLNRHVPGSPDHMDGQELWRRAWPIIETEQLKHRERTARRYTEAAHTEYAGNTIEEVTPRAAEGRVDELIVALDRQIWGTFKPQTLTTQVHDERLPGDRELLEFTAAQTLLHGGSVFGVQSHELPSGSLLTATFRY